jgi:hypothetical protein
MEIAEKIKEIYKLADEIQKKNNQILFDIEIYQSRKYESFFKEIKVSIYFVENNQVSYLLSEKETENEELDEIIKKIKKIKEEI